jgi:CP family cyanate transporter-like MFS transporter
LVLPMVGDSWRASLAVWGAPLIAIAILAILLAPRSRGGAAIRPVSGRNWWPDWRNLRIWQLGFLFGSINSIYFCTNAFLPAHLTSAGRPDLIGSALTALNFGQLPASFALLTIAGWLERRAWPFIWCGALMLFCLAGIAGTANLWTVIFAGLLGFLGAFVMTLGFALPALLSAPAEMARTASAMFTISYSEALVISVLSGAAWDFAGDPRFAFLPIVASGLPLLFVPAALQFRRVS